MRPLTWLVVVLAACAVEERSPHPVSSADAYDLYGELPDGVDLDEVVAQLSTAGFAIVSDPGTGQTATLVGASMRARVASGEFSVSTPASCLDCGDPTCAVSTRTLSIGLRHDSGIDGETYSVQTASATNFAGAVTTPSSWSADVGDDVVLTTTGTLPACAPFAYYFDVIGPDAPPPWRRTITVDGDLGDWLVDERFETSQGAGTASYVTWDDDTLFVGVQHPDVTTGGDQHWVVLTLGNGAGPATVGTQLGNQQPDLPFGATHVVRWRANDTYSDILGWDGADWEVIGAPTYAENDAAGTVEFAIPLVDFGLSDRIDLHVNWVYEGFGSESSYAATPQASFPQGDYDPDYGQFFAFDRSSDLAPGSYPPSP